MTTSQGTTPSITKRHPIEPPGGLMIWLFILMELLVFGIAFLVFFYMRSKEPNVFHQAQQHLDKHLALLNTLILITSSYFVAQANQLYKEKTETTNVLSSRFLFLGMLLGMAFLVLKGYEYAEKIRLGLTTGTNTFFDFYWLLTAFHAAHIFLGVFMLLYFSIRVRRGKRFSEEEFTLTAGGAWWHMCDLIWVLLFPVLYLL